MAEKLHTCKTKLENVDTKTTKPKLKTHIGIVAAHFHSVTVQFASLYYDTIASTAPLLVLVVAALLH